MNDAELLRRYAEEGSQEAFAELVRLRIGLVYSAALRQTGGDVYRAQDVAQTVFTDLARKANSLCGHRALIGWLYTSTRYAATTMARSERRRHAREEEAHTMHEDLAIPTPEIPPECLRPLLDDAMHQLPEIDRRALLLRFFDNYSMAELGQSLGLSESTAQKKVERALGKLKALLTKRGLSSTAAAVAAAVSQEAAAATAPVGLAATISGSALAAALTSGPAIGLISSMTASKLTAIVGVSVILGLASIGTGVYELRKSHRAEATVETVAQRYEAEQQQLRALSLNAQAADETLGDLQMEVNKAAAAEGQAKYAAAKARADWQRFAKAYPEARAVLVDWLRNATERAYRLAIERGDLMPAQLEEIANRTADLRTQGISLNPNGISLGSSTSLPDEQLRAILGEQTFQQVQNSLRMGTANTILANIASSAGYAGSPLSNDEEVQLAQIVADNSPTFQNGKSVAWNSVDWANVGTQAQSLLSPSQWKVAEGTFRDFQYQSALDQAQRSQSANPPAGEGEN